MKTNKEKEYAAIAGDIRTQLEVLNGLIKEARGQGLWVKLKLDSREQADCKSLDVKIYKRINY
jgi:hypothetical protein